MSLLDESDRADFAIFCVAAGFDPTDFELTAIENSSGSGIHAVRGTVTVLRKSTSIRVAYHITTERSWLLTFENDLRDGKFGQV